MYKIRSEQVCGYAPCVLRRILFAAGFLFVNAMDVSAQMFGTDADLQQPVPQIAVRPAAQPRSGARPSEALPNRPSPTVQTQSMQSVPTASSQEESEEIEDNDIRPNISAFQLRFVGNDVEVDLEPKIFLYLRDYRIDRNMNGSINCTMKFFVNSTLGEKISNISYRLKWPNMETALSFDDVKPNLPVYFEYSLLGKGCYDLDKAPNIIVNRCRVKGMSQKECADAIRWRN